MSAILTTLFVLFGSGLAFADQLFVSQGASWKYLANGSNQGTAWQQITFDDSAWSAGPSPLGYGDGDEATVVGYGGTSTSKSITTYFRHRFTVQDPASFESLLLRLQRDDGAVVYLNGVEIVRSNMPTGTITSSTLAASVVDGANESAFFDSSLAASLLRTGENVLAVEIHQINGSSSDISFNLELKGITKVPSIAVLPIGSTWKYLDTGVNPGSEWPALTYDDAAWASGAAELGYGDGNEATVVSFGPSSTSKYITTYFRRVLDVADPLLYKALKLRLMRDDGAVVYVNGVEVYRNNMPAGTVTPTTLASTAIADADESTLIETVVANTLIAGVNVIAVEMHQSAVTSSDLSFDLEILGLLEAPAVNVTRGPYLQNATPTSMVIRWRTDAPASSSVSYGTDAASLDQEIQDATLRTEHEINVTGLHPNTRYYYAIGTASGPLASGVEYSFFTPPPVGTRQPIRAWILGDSGTANSNAAAVRNAYTTFAGDRYTDLWLMLGDNAYNNGTDSEFQAAVFNMYPNMLRQSPLWSTLGNHEYYTAQGTPYFNIHTFPTQGEAGGVPSGTEKYYSFDYGNIHLICLDSMSSDRSATGAMATWLQDDLASTTQEWIVAFWHHPPYSFGSHNSDNVNNSDFELVHMRENFLPILEAGGVDLVLSGHSHSYERSYLIDGHYGYSSSFTQQMMKDPGTGKEVNGVGAYEKPLGLSANQGAVYAVAGSSGKATNWWGGSTSLINPKPHPTMVVSRLELGSVILDVNGSRMDAKFLSSAGAITDEFTIRKEIPNSPPTVAITSPTAGSVLNAPVQITAAATPGPVAEGGSVTQVDFYVGNVLAGSSATGDANGLFSIQWANAPVGVHSLTAVAWDDRGASTTSAPVSITVNSAPSVSITSPTAGQSFTVPATIQVAANAIDLEGTVTRVEFRAGTAVIGEATAAPFSITWNVPVTGTYQLTATAYDDNGATTTSAPVMVSVEEPNMVPTIALTNPSTGAKYNAPATVTINADAQDADGSIAQVEFYAGSQLLNTDTVAPFSFSWGNVAAGNYQITAVAKDNRGATATSSIAAILVNAVPSVNITSPTAGQTFTAPANIQVTANASDSDGQVTRVEFSAAGVVIGEATAAPYSLTWNATNPGTYQVTATAFDDNGSSTVSPAITVIVEAPNQLPTVQLTSPASGASFTSPATIAIGASAQDADGTIAQVEFYSGTQLLNTDAAAPFSYSWTNVAAGTYQIAAVAKDNRGGTATSQIVSITVAAPQVPTAPTALTTTAVAKARVDLKWTHDLANVTGYEVERSTSNTFNKAVAKFNVTAPATAYADTKVNANTQYYYRVRAMNGTLTSAWSNSLAVKTPR